MCRGPGDHTATTDRVAHPLDVDQGPLERFSDFAEHKHYDLLREIVGAELM
jgi:hypothetical protein